MSQKGSLTGFYPKTFTNTKLEKQGRPRSFTGEAPSTGEVGLTFLHRLSQFPPRDAMALLQTPINAIS